MRPRLVDDETLAGSSVVANCAMNRERGLESYRRELGIDVLASTGGSWVDLCCGSGKALLEADGRRLTKALREAGFSYDGRRNRIRFIGPGRPQLPFTYLGADDRAGPNYTGQPAVHSYYA